MNFYFIIFIGFFWRVDKSSDLTIVQWLKQVNRKSQRVVTLLFCCQVGYYHTEAACGGLKRGPKAQGLKRAHLRPQSGAQGPQGRTSGAAADQRLEKGPLLCIAFGACTEGLKRLLFEKPKDPGGRFCTEVPKAWKAKTFQVSHKKQKWAPRGLFGD